uniref:Putative small ubiquitin-related modifier protein n=1 Tax=Anopheles aquasalis TaxID=42839 RepID=T1DFZ2_ANOAQ
MADEKKDNKGSESEHINLKVLGQDNAVVQFKIKKHTPLRKLMNAYCDRAGLSMQVVRFRFDGQPINENDTPTTLEMEEGDTIEVYQQQTGGGVFQEGGEITCKSLSIRLPFLQAPLLPPPFQPSLPPAIPYVPLSRCSVWCECVCACACTRWHTDGEDSLC